MHVIQRRGAASPAVARRVGKQHSLELTFGRRAAFVRVAGEVDLMAAGDLQRLFSSLGWLDATIWVDLSKVVFLDSTGLQPIIDAARRRSDDGLLPLIACNCSPAARRLLGCGAFDGELEVRAAGPVPL